jgi:hypothetical protein
MAGSGLATAKPAFGAEVLEERMDARWPAMLTPVDRQRAADLLAPPIVIEEDGPAVVGLRKRARYRALECNQGCATGDGTVLDV